MRRFRFVLVIGLIFTTWQISSSFAWGGWIIQPVDSEGTVGQSTSIALDSSDYPHISYNDGTHGDLKYARWTPGEKAK